MWIYPILSLHCNTCAVDVQIYKCDRVFHHSMCQTLGCKGFFLSSAGSLETPKGGMPDVTYLQGCGASVQKPKKRFEKMPIPILSNHPISQFNISHPLIISSGSKSSIQNSTRSTHWSAPWTGRWHGAPSASPEAPWKSSPVAPLADGHSRNPNWRHLSYISPM